MSEKKVIEIKKSELALYRGMNLDNQEIANKMNLTIKEVAEALVYFGLKKRLSTTNTKSYVIKYVDDVEMNCTVSAEISKSEVTELN